MRKAEEIAFFLEYAKIAVISGIGVRNYYRKQEYNDITVIVIFQIKALELDKVDIIECEEIDKKMMW